MWDVGARAIASPTGSGGRYVRRDWNCTSSLCWLNFLHHMEIEDGIDDGF